MDFKRIAVLLILLSLFHSCSNDAMPDCLQSAGKIISYEVATDDFTSIHISEGIELVISEGAQQKIVVQTGENLRKDIGAKVTDGELRLRNDGSCNWVRDYNITKIYVTTPHLERIYSASQFAVKSNGVLTFPSLSLQSGIFSETASGAFEMELNCQNLTVEDNQSVFCKMSGNVENLTVNFYAGDARFDGRDLVAQKVLIFHRSSNDIILNAEQEVKGTLYSTGNLVLKNQPPVVEVERLYSGKVIYD